MASNYLHNGDRLARVVRELNGASAEKVERGRRAFALKSHAFAVGTAILLLVGAPVGAAMALTGHPWSGAALTLTMGVLGGLGYSRASRYRAYATALVPVEKAEQAQLLGLAQQSDVVRVAFAKAQRYSRVLYRADLLYARTLIVREARFGGRPSDKMPLEHTKGLLAALPGEHGAATLG